MKRSHHPENQGLHGLPEGRYSKRRKGRSIWKVGDHTQQKTPERRPQKGPVSSRERKGRRGSRNRSDGN